MRIGARHLPPWCLGGTISGGNYNDGFDKDPLIYLCIESEETLSSRDAVADDAPGKVYVSGLHMQEFEYKVKKPTCPEGMEAVGHNPDAGYHALTTPFKFAGGATTYFVLCLTKSRVVVAGAGDGSHFAASNFLRRIFVDDQRERPLRIDFRANDEIDWLAQQSDAKDARVVNGIFG